jgi:soluble lytic murein transglycosylase-like protein
MFPLADPVRQPQRFVQQADALIRDHIAHGGPDPVGALDAHLEQSFAHALENAVKPPEPPAPAPVASPALPSLAIHQAPNPFLTGMPDAGVAAFHGIINPAASGPLMTYGAYMSPPVTGIPNASLEPVAPQRVSSAPMGAELESLIGEMSAKYTVPDWVVRNVIRQESGGNANATSPVGAQGLMQLMPGTAAGLGVTNAYDPRQNVEGGVKYLKQLMDQFHGDLTKTVAAYNAGPGAVMKYGGVPPYAETQNYVKRVLG